MKYGPTYVAANYRLTGRIMMLLSNVKVFYAIAEEAHEAMQRSVSENRIPKPEGTGYVVTSDHGLSFKYACITIAFSGMFLEAATYFVALKGKSKSQAEKVDALKSYSRKLDEVGITNPQTLQGADRLQRARRDLVHEKAMSLGGELSKVPMRAQIEAEAAYGVIRAIREQLSVL